MLFPSSRAGKQSALVCLTFCFLICTLVLKPINAIVPKLVPSGPLSPAAACWWAWTWQAKNVLPSQYLSISLLDDSPAAAAIAFVCHRQNHRKLCGLPISLWNISRQGAPVRCSQRIPYWDAAGDSGAGWPVASFWAGNNGWGFHTVYQLNPLPHHHLAASSTRRPLTLFSG